VCVCGRGMQGGKQQRRVVAVGQSHATTLTATGRALRGGECLSMPSMASTMVVPATCPQGRRTCLTVAAEGMVAGGMMARGNRVPMAAAPRGPTR
jgi:hypothetical protein